ncbi:MAG: SBBP repeat-containing protein [Actinobacteria bacterium]|nr:SBBP repeat-containing protein [Actinomycetota bacterium]
MQAPRLVLPHGVLPTRGVPRPQVAFLVVAALAASLVVVSSPLHPVPAASSAGAETRAVEGYGELPISFEHNVGQAPNRFDFVARGQGFGMAISATGATLALGTKEAQDLVRLDLLGANRSAHPRALESLPGVVNYFIGNDPAKWRSDVSTFGRVSYREILPGIDVTYYGTNAGTLEYDFVVAPNADPKDIRVGFSGARAVTLQDGALVITTASGAVTQEAPVLYQTIGGRRVPVAGAFSLDGDEVGFEVGAYDHHHPLVIDPTLVYSTYLGGSGDDIARGVAVNSAGEAYVTGSTTSTSFPPQAPFQVANGGGTDVFVTKLSADGQTLVYSTYLGGSGTDVGYGIALDSSGAAHVTGSTNSPNFPAQAPSQVANGGGTDVFVTKLNAAGQALDYSTYLGGLGTDIGHAITVDGSGSAYVTGWTLSANFPTQAPISATNAGAQDVFVTKLNVTGARVYSTYLGGLSDDVGYGIAVDGTDSAYVTGAAASNDFPTQAPLFGANAGNYDVFVTKLNPAGSALIYSTYLGGSDADTGYGIALNGSGEAHVTGSTASTNFQTLNPFQPSNGGGTDAFVTKLNAAGSGLVYSTYLGGVSSVGAPSTDIGYGIAVDGSGAAHVTGSTFTTTFPMQAPSQPSNGGGNDAFVTKLNVGGQTLAYSTYLGGSGADLGYGIALDSSSAAYVTGVTASPNFPTQAPFQPSNAGSNDGFITKLGVSPTSANLSLAKSDSSDPINTGQALTYTLTVQNAGPDPATGVTITDTLPAGVTFVSASPGCSQASGTVTCSVANVASGASAQVQIQVTPNQPGTITNTASVAANEADPQTADNQDDEQTVVSSTVTCGGQPVTIQAVAGQVTFGTPGDDVINGTPGDDYLSGLGGDDISCGLGGNDMLRDHGDGNDTMFGGAGEDDLYGQTGNDILKGGSGNDDLYGEAGNDILKGGGGSDTLYGGDDDDDLFGGSGPDYLFGETGAETMYGNSGYDVMFGGDGDDDLFGNDGSDYVLGGSGDDDLSGGPDEDVCYGDTGMDSHVGASCESFIQ